MFTSHFLLFGANGFFKSVSNVTCIFLSESSNTSTLPYPLKFFIFFSMGDNFFS